MNTSPLPAGSAGLTQLEGEADKRRRIEREAGELARARASAAAGRVVDSATVKQWIDSIGTDHELPCKGGYRVLYEVHPDTGRNDDAGDVLVLRVHGPGQSRDRF